MKTNVLLLFGVESSEHDVSLVSARNVYDALDKDRYDITLVHISRDGKWGKVEDFDNLEKFHAVAPVLGKSRLIVAGQGEIKVDVLFPVLHGKNGEDGTVQGLAQLLHTPIVGCNIEASSICMDKDRTKRLLRDAGIAVAPWVTFALHDNYEAVLAQPLDDSGFNDITRTIGNGPWFVKPARAGSSVGVTKVKRYEDLAAAIKVAHQHDTQALVEQAIVGRELEVAVLGNVPHIEASSVGEIVPGEEFYSYDDKYSPESKSQVILKADMPDSHRQMIREQALRAYEAVGCSGLARVDFMLSEDATPYVNEINTMPGFTNISMYPKLMMQTGLSYPELCAKLISLALEV